MTNEKSFLISERTFLLIGIAQHWDKFIRSELFFFYMIFRYFCEFCKNLFF